MADLAELQAGGERSVSERAGPIGKYAMFPAYCVSIQRRHAPDRMGLPLVGLSWLRSSDRTILKVRRAYIGV